MAANFLVLVLCGLNVLDGFLTIKADALGVPEANPVLKPLLDADPMLFLVVKMVVFLFALTFLDRRIRRPLHRYVLFGSMTFLYALVICWHVAGLHELA